MSRGARCARVARAPRELQVYTREEIRWSYINYDDNQPCIELIEASMGIFSLMDEVRLGPLSHHGRRGEREGAATQTPAREGGGRGNSRSS